MKYQIVVMSIVFFSSLSGAFCAEDVPQEIKRPKTREDWKPVCIWTAEQILAAGPRMPSDDGVAIVGAAEVLLALRDTLRAHGLSETSDLLQRLDREWKKYLSAAIAQKPTSLPAEMNWHRRAILLKLICTTVGQDQFKKTAELAVERDPDNGVAWMFLAEQKWAESNYRKTLACIQEVAKKNWFTLHDALRHRRMRYALDKLGIYRKSLSWLLPHMVDSANEFEVFNRHAALLRYAPALGLVCGYRDKKRIRESLANEYLSLLTFSGSPGTGVWANCAHGILLPKGMMSGRNGERSLNSNDTSDDGGFMVEEGKILRTGRDYLRFETRILHELAVKGNVEEIDAFLLDPIVWREKCLQDWSKESSQMVGVAQWREYWTKRKMAEGETVDEAKRQQPRTFEGKRTMTPSEIFGNNSKGSEKPSTRRQRSARR